MITHDLLQLILNTVVPSKRQFRLYIVGIEVGGGEWGGGGGRW